MHYIVVKCELYDTKMCKKRIIHPKSKLCRCRTGANSVTSVSEEEDLPSCLCKHITAEQLPIPVRAPESRMPTHGGSCSAVAWSSIQCNPVHAMVYI